MSEPVMGVSNPAVGISPAPWHVVAVPGGAGIVDAAGVHVVSTVVTGTGGYWIDPAVAALICDLVNSAAAAPEPIPAGPPPGSGGPNPPPSPPMGSAGP